MPVEIESFQSIEEANILLEADGSLWTWGFSGQGLLGVADTWGLAAPAQILDSVTYAAQSGRLAIREDNSLWGWGLEMWGPPRYGRPVPFAPRFIMDDVVHVISTVRRDFAIRSDNSLWAIDHRMGPRRNVHLVTNTEPVRILDSVAAVYSTLRAELILQCGGQLWVLRDDQLTHIMDDVVAVYERDNLWAVFVPDTTLVIQADGNLWSVNMLARGNMSLTHIMGNVSTVFRAYGSNFILGNDTGLWAMGNNDYGRLGTGNSYHQSYPVWIMDGAANVFPLQNRTFVITTCNALWAWGSNAHGGLGIGSLEDNHLYPAHVMDRARHIYFSGADTYVVGVDNTLWMWGNMVYEGTRIITKSPMQIKDYTDRLYIANRRIFAVDIYNTLWTWQFTWGSWDLPIHNQPPIPPPRQVLEGVSHVFLDTFNPFISIAFIFPKDGSIWAMGTNLDELLGDVTRACQYYPVNISYIFS